MKKTSNTRRKLALGGDIGDPTKPKNAKKVKVVPQGYIPMEGIPNYYYRTTRTGSGQSQAKGPKMSDAAWRAYVRSPEYLTKKAANTDYVYIEPEQVAPIKPTVPDYMVKNMDSRIYNPDRSVAGDYQYNVLKGDITNPKQGTIKTVNFRPTDKIGKPTGDYYEGIPEGDFSNAMKANGDVFNPSLLDKWSKYKKKNTETAMAMGGEITGLISQLPQLMGLLDQLSDGKQAYSKQPIVNASTARNMVSPYTSMDMGGTIDDLDDEELAGLQEMADQQGITVEEALQQVQQDQNTDDEGDETSESEDIAPDEDDGFGSFGDEEDTYALGGNIGKKKVEVEGKEVVETPDGQVGKVQGPSHENGGVDATLPVGSQVFSKRLKIEGKSMADRKLVREKRAAKLQKLISKNPDNMLLRNTYKRTMSNLASEDQQDMTLQKVASHIYAPPSRNSGTRELPRDNTKSQSNKMAFGDIVGDPLEMYPEYAARINGLTPPYPATPPFVQPGLSRGGINAPLSIPSLVTTNPIATTPKPLVANKPVTPIGLTTGDLVGMAGTAFGAISGLANTNAAARATPPNINRFRGYGHDAIQSNDDAQSYLAGELSNDLTNIDTSANSGYMRNNNSSSSINTARALNTVTDMARNKARSAARSNYAKGMMGLLGQRGQLTNMRDFREMSGDKQVDTENKMDIDNYYTTRSQVLQGIAQAAQVFGRDLNISHGNQVDAELLSQLSRYNLTIDKNGRIVNKK